MNILAHCYLSGNNPDILLGNFIADGMSRKQWEKLPPTVIKGVRLHHFIDSFTDQHPEVIRCVNSLRPSQAKYAPVVTDILFDHFLARDWSKYHTLPLEHYVRWVHQILDERTALMLPDRQRMFSFMKTYKWLEGYARQEGIERVLQGMARRSRFPSNMANAFSDYLAQKPFWEDRFHGFFPQLQTAVESELHKGE